MTYPEAIKYLELFINYEKIPAYPYKQSLKLERIKDFLCLIGNPQDSLRCIHIAGSKGKGSTCAFITYILREAGYKVGLYTSPHLSDFRERIRILTPDSRLPTPNRDFEGMISKGELAGLINKLKPKISKYNKISRYGPLSFFEVYTALAFVYFKEKKIDFAVLETGLGGRLDATNVVSPLVCAITPISYEHTQKLGNTLKQIASEKAGIIKDNRSIVISAPQEAEARKVIKDRCGKVGAILYKVGKDISYIGNNRRFHLNGISRRHNNLQIRLLGQHQIINAAVAVAVVEALGPGNIKINAGHIKKGLYKTVWPGRCEIVSRDPLIVLDGAQNSASAKVLKNAIKENFRYSKLILVLGISNDKDIAGVCSQVCPSADKIILTQADNPRAANVAMVKRIIMSLHRDARSPVIETKAVKQAKVEVLKMAGKEDLVLVTGSLFVVGEFRNA